MLANFFGLFRSKNKDDLTFLEVFYFQHDPSTNKLLVCNNGMRSTNEIRLVVKNDQLMLFTKNLDKLEARSSNLLALADLLDNLQRPFSGTIKEITLYHKGRKAVFVPDVYNLKRIK